MIKLKVGGMILTGFAAFLVAEKVVGTLNQAVIGCCEASKWKGYYKCWSKGQAKGDPVPPGYSMTSRPDKADYEVVYDPSGKDHQHDNDPKEEGKRDHSDTVKTVCEAVKTVAEKAIDTFTKQPDEPEEAKEDDSEASGPVSKLKMEGISRLITEMTIKGASQEEIERAVRYSVDVIESGKRKVNLVQSYADNGINELIEKYYGGVVNQDEDGNDILCPEQFDKAPGDSEPLYHDDLEEGVKVTYENVDDIFKDFDKESVSDKYSYTDSEKTEVKEKDQDETVD